MSLEDVLKSNDPADFKKKTSSFELKRICPIIPNGHEIISCFEERCKAWNNGCMYLDASLAPIGRAEA